MFGSQGTGSALGSAGCFCVSVARPVQADFSWPRWIARCVPRMNGPRGLTISVRTASVNFLTSAGHNMLCAAWLLASAGFLTQRSRTVVFVPFAELFGF